MLTRMAGVVKRRTVYVKTYLPASGMRAGVTCNERHFSPFSQRQIATDTGYCACLAMENASYNRSFAQHLHCSFVVLRPKTTARLFFCAFEFAFT